jgi:hypothetical protein
MFAPGTTPPFGSVIVPEIVPVMDCANEVTVRIEIEQRIKDNVEPSSLMKDIEGPPKVVTFGQTVLAS